MTSTVSVDLRPWSRFSAPPVAQRWYYRSLAEVFSRRVGNQLSATFNRTVEEMTAGLPAEVVLPPMNPNGSEPTT